MKTKLVHNVETGEVSEIELTSSEIAQQKKDAEEAATQKTAELNKEATKAALLQRLGLTAEEAALLLA